ncbi:MAG TPA: carboxylesterase family protein, partial [Ferruginibacter sp.]|nr:carboxylesterase family protein [Ferruginibacter sp.]
MKKKSFILFFIALFFFSCKKEDTTQPQAPHGLYDSMLYMKTNIQIQEVAYTTRPNFHNLQYTSEVTKQTEISQNNLTPKMDIYLPPNASATKRQPLLVMIHGGGYSSGDKNAW